MLEAEQSGRPPLGARQAGAVLCTLAVVVDEEPQEELLCCCQRAERVQVC
ncbi:hypothetical protein [Streptomyces sp. NPDC001070]